MIGCCQSAVLRLARPKRRTLGLCLRGVRLAGSGQAQLPLVLARLPRPPISDMRVLLRNRRTRLYYAGHTANTGLNDSATTDPQALDFGDVRSAAKFSLEEHLTDMEIVLHYDSCDGEIALPVLPEWCLFEERSMRPVTAPA